MAQDERLTFDIFARLREDGFAKAAKAASGASDEVVKLAERLDKLGEKSTRARISLDGDKEALAQLDKLQLKMISVGNKLIDPKIDIQGEAKAQAELAALTAQMDKLGSKSADVTKSVGSGGLSGGAGLGALIGAGVALSPIIATIATGVAGFGAAAYGSIGPLIKAAQATGGLQANMAKLNPEQQALGKSVLALGQQYHAFEKSLEPEVLSVFGKGIQLAGHLMHDVQPIAQATGKALGQMLGAIDKEFQSGTWQKFFSFMANTAGPDIKLVTENLTSFMELLPPLLMDLQPVATALLNLSNDLLKVAASATKGFGSLTSLNSSAADTPKHAGLASQAWHLWEQSVRGAEDATAKLFNWIPGLNTETAKTATVVHSVGMQAQATVTPVFNLTTALKNLTSAQQKNVDELLTEQGNLLGWQQALNAAKKQLDSNTAGLKGNSNAAIANRQFIFNSTQAAEQFAESQSHAGGDIAKATQVIQEQIRFLEIHAGKSKFAAAEVAALRVEEDKLKNIRQQIKVSASGTWSVTGGAQTGTRPTSGPPGAARGIYVAHGQPGVDDQLIMAQRGELVVPTRLVSAGAVDHLRGMIPGFADGGVIGNYSGSVGGMPKWLMMEDSATLRALSEATAKATAAGIRSAQAAGSGGGFGVPGPGGGTPAANAALARKMYPSVNWPAWNYVAMAESGWNNLARNPGSGAYGIPQALPPSKMGPAANPPQSNPAAQISWMVGYMNSRYGGSPGAAAHERAFHWYAKGGPVGGKAAPVDPQKKKWLAQLERDVKTLEADQKHARERRKILRHSVEIDQLWFLTHPDVKKHGIGYDEHERALRNDERRLTGFNKREADREKELTAKIAILRDLTGYPRGKKYGGPGTPGGGAGSGSGGGGTGGGGTTAPPPPPSPPPIPPPPEPVWMVQAGLGSDGAAAPVTFPGMGISAGGIGFPEPVTFGGGGFGGGGMGGGGFAGMIAALQAMHRDLVGAVGMVAPGTTRGMDRNLNSMSARVAGRFS